VINFPSPDKLILLAIIALVVLGPSRLPGAARSVGKVVGDLRRLMNRFQDEIHGALADPKDAFTSAIGDLRDEVGGLRSDMGGFTQRAKTLTGTALTGATMTDTTMSGAAPAVTSTGPSNGASDTVPSALVLPGLPPLPPAPDDPSLN
jgi:sec-independent protein translocase protein TatB